VSLWPRSLGVRIAGALVFAVGAVLALSLAVSAGGRPALSSPAVVVVPFAADLAHEAPRVAVPFVGGPILLALRPSSLEPAVAPVVQLLADGGMALRRPAPRAQGPSGAAETTVDGAAIVLPGAGLAGLDPRARSALVELVGQLVRERPVPAARFRTVDFALPVAELERLLQWVP
jgi:hypothetical protein